VLGAANLVLGAALPMSAMARGLAGLIGAWTVLGLGMGMAPTIRPSPR
jgi:hypothetical protein